MKVNKWRPSKWVDYEGLRYWWPNGDLSREDGAVFADPDIGFMEIEATECDCTTGSTAPYRDCNICFGTGIRFDVHAFDKDDTEKVGP